MKFLEYTPLAKINSFLKHINVGDGLVKGLLEAYSCKLAGADKKLSQSLEQEVIDSLLCSSSSPSTSPMGPLSSLASRRTFIHLILALNHIYPDYDFSQLRPNHFIKEDCLDVVKGKIEDYLFEASKVWATEFGDETSLLGLTWDAVDEVIEVEDCSVYTYAPDPEVDPLSEEGTIWSFLYFFYNRKLRRVLCFGCRCLSKLGTDEDYLSEIYSEEEAEYYMEGMDMD